MDGRITAWNRGAERIYGYTEAEARNLRLDDLVPQDERAVQKEVIEQIARDEEVQSYETRRVTQDGRRLDVWVTVTRLTDERGQTCWTPGQSRCRLSAVVLTSVRRSIRPCCLSIVL